MRLKRYLCNLAFAGIAAAAIAAPAVAQETIKIVELNSYEAFPAILEPYKNGMALALDEINAKGGVLGRKLEVIIRDDGANPGEALRVADELVTREGVKILAGSFLSNIGLAVANYARQKKVFYLAGEPLTDKIVWQDGNKYTFRLRPSTYMQTAMLVSAAVSAHKKRWALIYPNDEYGQSAAAAFKGLMKKAQPEVEFVAEQATPLGKVDASAVAQAIDDAKPDAIFNALFGGDLANFVRVGTTRGTFKDRTVVSLLTGEPEYLDPLKAEAPAGWIVTGYPYNKLKAPEHFAFLNAYATRFKTYPRMGSVVGYMLIRSLAAGIEAANSTEPDKVAAAFEGLHVSSPFGAIQYRAIDHQSTMGTFVGKIAIEKGKGTLVDFTYVGGASVMPPDAVVRKMRPASAN